MAYTCLSYFGVAELFLKYTAVTCVHMGLVNYTKRHEIGVYIQENIPGMKYKLEFIFHCIYM